MTTEQCWYRHRARKHTSWRCIRIDPHIRQRAKLDGSDGELRIRPAMGETFGPAECGRPSALWRKNFPLCTGIRACDQNTTPLSNIYRDGDLLRVR